jgi:branched-chain amino acid transport system permease protein
VSAAPPNFSARLRRRIRSGSRDVNQVTYTVLLAGAILLPFLVTAASPNSSSFWISIASDAGVFVLLAIGLNVVVGLAGLLDLGYAAFFAIGAYTAGILSSGQLGASPLHRDVHIIPLSLPFEIGGVQVQFGFWLLLLLAMFVAATFGILLGAPTLRLRGDYLAIVTLGFGEIVPRVFRNLGFGNPLGNWTSGVNGISALDAPTLPVCLVGPWDGRDLAFATNCVMRAYQPMAYYVTMVILIIIAVILVRNLQRSRLGRAWMAIREDEVAAAAMGVNTVTTKLLAFSIGASLSGFAGCFYGTKLSLVSPEAFTFTVSVTVLVMVVLGGMGNIPGVIVGALAIYGVLFYVLTNLPFWAESAAQALGLNFLVKANSAAHWPGIHDELQHLNFLVFGIILVAIMLLRPQGLLPNRIREFELAEGVTDESVFDARTT